MAVNERTELSVLMVKNKQGSLTPDERDRLIILLEKLRTDPSYADARTATGVLLACLRGKRQAEARPSQKEIRSA